MKDPKPENIAGSKRVVHKVEHRIQWGYVAAGIGALALAFVLYRAFSGASGGESDDSSNAEVYDA